MSKRNKRRISCVVSAQTLYHLQTMAEFSKCPIGHVIDKLVRQKQLSLNLKGEQNFARSKNTSRRNNR